MTELHMMLPSIDETVERVTRGIESIKTGIICLLILKHILLCFSGKTYDELEASTDSGSKEWTTSRKTT